MSARAGVGARQECAIAVPARLRVGRAGCPFASGTALYTLKGRQKGALCNICAASFLKLSPSPRALLVRRSPLPSVVRTRQRARDVPPLLFFRKRDLLAQFLPRAAFGNSASVFWCGGHCSTLALACGPVRATAAETEALGPRPARSTSSRPTHSGPSLTSPDHYLRTHLPGPALSEPTSCAPQVIHRPTRMVKSAAFWRSQPSPHAVPSLAPPRASSQPSAPARPTPSMHSRTCYLQPPGSII